MVPDLVGRLAELEQRQGEGPGPLAEHGRAGVLQLGRPPRLVGVTQPGGSLATCTRERPGQAAAGEDDVVLEVHEPELREPADGALERRAPPAPGAEAERRGPRPRWRAEPGRVDVEAVGELPAEEHGARPEQRQPERSA